VISLSNRNRQTAKRAVLAYAKEAFVWWEVRGAYKDPGALWKSFRKRLQASSAFDALVSDKRLSLEVIGELSGLLVDFYDDPDIPNELPPEWEAVRETGVARENQLRCEADVLAKAAARVRTSNCEDAAEEVEAIAEKRLRETEELREIREHYERSAPPGQPLLRSPGAPKRPEAAFAEAAERLLARQQPVPYGEKPIFENPPHLAPPDRHRLIASLVTDFYRATEAEQIRKLLLDAKLRTDRRRQKWLAEKTQPTLASKGFNPHPCFVPTKSPQSREESNPPTGGRAGSSHPRRLPDRE